MARRGTASRPHAAVTASLCGLPVDPRRRQTLARRDGVGRAAEVAAIQGVPPAWPHSPELLRDGRRLPDEAFILELIQHEVGDVSAEDPPARWRSVRGDAAELGEPPSVSRIGWTTVQRNDDAQMVEGPSVIGEGPGDGPTHKHGEQTRRGVP